MEKFRFDPALREKSRADLHLKPDEIALLFAGSGWERKGLRFAIEAFELCRGHKLGLLVAGRGDARSYKPKRFFTKEPVRFLGEVSDLCPIYAAADGVRLPVPVVMNPVIAESELVRAVRLRIGPVSHAI